MGICNGAAERQVCDFNCMTFATVEPIGKYASMHKLANTAWALTTVKPSSRCTSSCATVKQLLAL